jgi:hypothetical protein
MCSRVNFDLQTQKPSINDNQYRNYPSPNYMSKTVKPKKRNKTEKRNKMKKRVREKGEKRRKIIK